MVGADRDRRLHRPCVRAAPARRTGRACGAAAQVASRLARRARLAPRRALLLRQRDLFQRERVPSDLPGEPGPLRSHQRRAARAEPRPVAGVVAAACRRGTARAPCMALPGIGRAFARQHRRPRLDGRPRDDRVGRRTRILGRGRADPRPDAAAAAVPSRGRRPHVGRDVHAELRRRGRDRGRERRCLGPERNTGSRFRPARGLRGRAGGGGEPDVAQEGIALAGDRNCTDFGTVDRWPRNRGRPCSRRSRATSRSPS